MKKYFIYLSCAAAFVLGGSTSMAQTPAKTDTVVKPQDLPVSTVAPDFTLMDADGKPVSLSSFRGKYVLVDFWASWCPDCIRENPNIVEAYKRFKDKNFTVIGVSFDRTKEAWLSRIAKDGLTWTQLFAPGGWKSDVSKAYGIHWIPTAYLIDPEGKIVAVGLTGQALLDKLAELL